MMMKNIFVIDDDRVYRKAMESRLAQLGYETKGFESIIDALPALVSRPDVIFLDHHYAHSLSKGYEFIELIRLHTKDSLIVYISSDPKEEVFKNALHPADAYLKKDDSLFDNLDNFLKRLFEYKKKKDSIWYKFKARFLGGKKDVGF